MIKKILLLLSGLIATAFILSTVAVIYVLNWNPNNHKEWLADTFFEQSGRSIRFDGELKLAIYPWLSLELNQVEISNGEGFSNDSFLSAEHAEFRIKLMPLLNEQYEIDTVLLQNASIHLEVNAAGQNNWSGLLGKTTREDETSTGPATDSNAISKLVLGGVDIQNASLSFSDQVSSQQININDFNMTIAELVYGQPLQVNLSFNSSISNPQLNSQSSLDSTIIYDLDQQQYQLSPITINSTLSGPNIPGGNTTLSLETSLNIDLAADTITIPALALNALGTQLSASITASNIQTEFPVLQTDFSLVGNDLALLFQIAEVEDLAQQISKLDNKNFDISGSANIDLQSSDLSLNTVEANLLGATILADITAHNLQSSTPVFNGTLNASGPDLPTLLEIVGQIQGDNGIALKQTAQNLQGINNRYKSFSVLTDFDADLESGNISLPKLNAEALGLNINATLNAEDIQSPTGAISGELTLDASNADELLAALGQTELSALIQSLQLNTTVAGNRNDIRISPFTVNLQLAGPQLPNAPVSASLQADSVINLDEETLSINALTLSVLGLSTRGSLQVTSLFTTPAAVGEVEVDPFNLRQLMTQLNQDLPAMADNSTLANVSFSTRFSTSAEQFSLENFTAVLDESNITGHYLMQNPLVQSSDSLKAEFALSIDQLNADRYLSTETTATNSTQADTGFALDELQTLSVNGTLDIGQLTIANVSLANIAVTLKAENGQVNLAPVSANLYQGNYDGSVFVDSTGAIPIATIESNLKNISLGPLLQDFMGDSYITGDGNITLSLNGSGNDITAVKSSLNGAGNIEISNGILSGVDVASVLTQVETMLRNRRFDELERGQQTAFDSLYSTLNINQGIVRSNDLLLVAPGFNVNGRGTLVDLNSDTINFTLITSVDPSTATSNDEEYDLGGYDLPIACTGTLESPSCLPDTAEIVRQALSNALQNEIGDFLQRALGVEETQSQPSPDETKPEANTEEPMDPRQELINSALERLLR